MKLKELIKVFEDDFPGANFYIDETLVYSAEDITLVNTFLDYTVTNAYTIGEGWLHIFIKEAR